jgi:hypothetical protein
LPVVSVDAPPLHPIADMELSATVLKVNKMGVYAVAEEAMRILLPRDLHTGSPTFDALKAGDTVNVRILRSLQTTHDPFIMAVGTLSSVAAHAAAM